MTNEHERSQYEETNIPILDLVIDAVYRAEQAGHFGAHMAHWRHGAVVLDGFLKMSLKICSEKMSSAVVFIVVLTMGQAVRLVYRLLSSFYAAGAGNDMIFSVSIFQEQAGADESTRTATDRVKQNLAALVEGPPEIITDEMKTYIAK